MYDGTLKRLKYNNQLNNKMTTISEVYDAYLEALADYGGEVNVVDCAIRFRDDGEERDVTIKLNEEVEKDDDKIFFYVPDIECLLSFMSPQSTMEDFVITKVYRIYNNQTN